MALGAGSRGTGGLGGGTGPSPNSAISDKYYKTNSLVIGMWGMVLHQKATLYDTVIPNRTTHIT